MRVERRRVEEIQKQRGCHRHVAHLAAQRERALQVLREEEILGRLSPGMKELLQWLVEQSELVVG